MSSNGPSGAIGARGVVAPSSSEPASGGRLIIFYIYFSGLFFDKKYLWFWTLLSRSVLIAAMVTEIVPNARLIRTFSPVFSPETCLSAPASDLDLNLRPQWSDALISEKIKINKAATFVEDVRHEFE